MSPKHPVPEDKPLSYPADKEFEESSLASILLSPEDREYIFEIFDPKFFFDRKRRRVFEEAKALHESGVPTGLLELGRFLHEKKQRGQLNGSFADNKEIVSYLASLADAPILASPQHGAKKLGELYARRQIMEVSEKAAQLAAGLEPVDEILELFNEEFKQRINANISESSLLTPEKTAVYRRLRECPPEREYLVRIGDIGFLPKGIVGGIVAAGGTGKSLFILQFATMLAGGGEFKPFSIDKPLKTLCLLAEDDQEEIDRRLWAISPGKFPENLHAASVLGKIGELMRLDGGNPVKTEWFTWLENVIKAHEGLDVLILDPLSQIYGLEENKTEHATPFIKALAALAQKYNLTILITHHTNKDSYNDKKLNANMVRGSSGIVYAFRWCLGMRRMIEPDTDKYGLTGNHVEMDLIKTNYSKQLVSSFFMELTDNGVFKHVSPQKTRIDSIAYQLSSAISELSENNKFFTRRELSLTTTGKPVISIIKDSTPDFKRKEIDAAIDYALGMGWIEEKKTLVGKNHLRVVYISKNPPTDPNYMRSFSNKIICEGKSDFAYKPYSTNGINALGNICESNKESHFNQQESLENICEDFSPLKGEGEIPSHFTSPSGKSEIAGTDTGKFSAENVPCKSARQEAHKCKYFSSIDSKGNIFCGYKCRGKPQPLKQIPPSPEACPYSDYWLKCIKQFPN